jgi:hypothetical protein
MMKTPEDRAAHALACQAAKSRRAEIERDKFCGVYFIAWGGFVKVGTGWSVRRRVADFSQALPTEPDRVGFIHLPGDDAGRFRAERQARMDLAAFVVKGEWFRDCPEVRAYIAQHAQPWPSDD